MIVFSQICNYCGNQIDLPADCEEDTFFKKDDFVKSKIYGVCLDMAINPIRSFEGYRRRTTKPTTFSFCGKECMIEFIKKSITEEGNLEIIK